VGVGLYLYFFLDSGARRGGWSAPRRGRFTPRKTRRLGGPQGRSGRVRIIISVLVVYEGGFSDIGPSTKPYSRSLVSRHRRS